MTSRLLLLSLLFLLFSFSTMNGQPEKTIATVDEPSTADAIKQLNEEKIAELSKQIAGKENQPAESVFKNIKILTGVPAGNVLKIMQFGYSRSLGTSCAHCHVLGQWDKDDKTQKRITRDMSKMDRSIVSDLLQNIEGLEDRKPIINCTTCHRGQLKPALNLDAELVTK